MLTKLTRSLLSKFLFSTQTIASNIAPSTTPSNNPFKSIVEVPKPQKHFKQLEYNVWQAIHLVKLHSVSSFEQTVDLCVRINVNPKNGDQIVRGTAVMPAGIGKETRVAIIANQEHREMCEEAGADIVDPNQIIKQIKANKIQFDKLFTTPQLLPQLKQFAKILGPKGLMPNLKLGTLVTKDKMSEAIKLAKAGEVTFRVDSGKNIHVPLGKMSFTENQLLDNMESVMKTISDKKPPAIKGKYFLSAYIKSTMGPRWKLKIDLIDPKHRQYLLDMRE